MTIFILLGCIAVALAALVAIFVLQARALRAGDIDHEEGYNGPAIVVATLHVIVRYVFRRSIHARKFIVQYIAHLAVRVMYYIDKLTTFLYAKSRNWFVQNAVRNRGTVPHFWEHLKVYKQEMDKEKEEDKE